MKSNIHTAFTHEPWSKGKLVGQKAPVKPKDIWAIRVRLELSNDIRNLALFNLTIDSKLRTFDLVELPVGNIAHGEHVSPRTIVMQQNPQSPVQFATTGQTRESLVRWMHYKQLRTDDFIFSSKIHASLHLSTRQDTQIVDARVTAIGLDPTAYRTHTVRRTKASLIHQHTKDLRAVQLLLGHTKHEGTERYLDIEADDALGRAEQT